MYFAFEKKTDAYEARHGNKLGPTPHLHNHIEIVLIEDGSTEATADLVEATANKGDLFIAFPNQVHFYLDKEPLVTHSIIIVSTDMTPDFSRIFKGTIPKTPVLKNAANNRRIVSAINSMLECRRENGEYSETEARGCMLILLSELFKNMELVEKHSLSHDLAKDIISYCYENYTNDISLQSIADDLHISRCYISRVFTRRLHIGFNDYINSLRVRSACEMLKAGEQPITEIAYAVGYNSVRTFDRCFLMSKGTTPREYRLKALEKKNKG